MTHLDTFGCGIVALYDYTTDALVFIVNPRLRGWASSVRAWKLRNKWGGDTRIVKI